MASATTISATIAPGSAVPPSVPSSTTSSSSSTTWSGNTWRMPPAAGSFQGIWDTAYPLKISNSMTRSKTTFVPMKGKQVLWYMCGPTVYDAAHMGHARTYVCFDILRRIMNNYFGYDVLLTMNITDIDDKIINKSAAEGVEFHTLARREEASFLADMEKLGVAPPDVMTRVSEYVPEIVSFVQRIIENGFAYESRGSVYFNVPEYRKSGKHTYGKIVPENVGNSAALDEGEGASAGATDKRDSSDFALWKAYKGTPGEPSWDSPWGKGRPGWHIECSAMCDGTLGPFANGRIDIHSGGVDLRFPHHDNEIAQSEACLNCPQWVNYFLHSGHLHIEGLKMSKSLKNFVKIADALEKYGARQLRLLFLLQKYNAPMHYSVAGMEGMAGVERTYLEFFDNVKAKLRGSPATVNQHWSSRDKDFAAFIATAKERIRQALSDDFNTPEAMSILGDLVKETNRYMLPEAGTGAQPVPLILKSSGDYVTNMFRVFGLADATIPIGGSGSGEGAGGSLETVLTPYLDVLVNFREQVRECARAGDTKRLLMLCDALRDEVLPPLGVKLEDGGSSGSSSSSSGGAAGAGAGGVSVATTTSSSKWKLRSPEDIRREAAEKAAAVEEKARKKAEAAAEAAKKTAEKEAKAAQDPRTMFTSQTDKYNAFDAEGVPTHDTAGVELPKNVFKKLKKDWEMQAKLHEWLKAKQSGKAGAGAGAGEVEADE